MTVANPAKLGGRTSPAAAPLLDRDRSWLALNGCELLKIEDELRDLGRGCRFASMLASNVEEFHRVRLDTTVCMERDLDGACAWRNECALHEVRIGRNLGSRWREQPYGCERVRQLAAREDGEWNNMHYEVLPSSGGLAALEARAASKHASPLFTGGMGGVSQ